jgi:hypothetical protein
VRELLERDVLGATEGRVQFHTRVAVNALRMVERELDDATVMQDRHRARLAALGCGSDAELADAIAAGALDSRLDEVRSIVLESVVDKLTVANPGYLHDDL